VATNVAAACLAMAAIRRLAGPSVSPANYRWRRLFSFSAVSWVSALASTGLLWADTLLLGLYGSASDVAVYQVATRLTLIVMIFMHSINASFAPRIAHLYRSGQRDSLGKLYSLVTSWIVRLSLPAFVLIMIFPQELLSIFGSEFTAGASITVLLAIGTLFDVLSGPCGHMLVMSGRPALTMVNNLCGLALNIGLNVLLIPRFGLMGAGIAWAASLALINLARVAQVWFTMHMQPVDRGLVKGVAAAAAAAVVAMVVRQAGGAGLPTLAVGALSIGAVYGAMIFLLGIDSDDRLVWRTLRHRLTGAGADAAA
jgi:O-antigen/teichoic acid export membrane protein